MQLMSVAGVFRRHLQSYSICIFCHYSLNRNILTTAQAGYD